MLVLLDVGSLREAQPDRLIACDSACTYAHCHTSKGHWPLAERLVEWLGSWWTLLIRLRQFGAAITVRTAVALAAVVIFFETIIDWGSNAR